VNCHICGQPSIGQCQNCWKFYCAKDGDLVCGACKDDTDIDEREPVVTYENTTPEVNSRERLVSVVVPNVELRVLRRVVPIGQSQTRSSTKITAASLELYEDGSRLIYSIRKPHVEEPKSVLERSLMYGFPRMLWEAVDDQGQAYKVARDGGGGGGAEWRFEAVLEPAIPEGATHLILTCSQVHWEAHGVGMRSRTQAGPWRFEIPLT